jgi:hypothetical protein
LQLTGTVFTVIPFSDTRLYVATLKWQALHSGRWRLSLLGGAAYAGGESYRTNFAGGETAVAEVSPQLGGVLSYCLTLDCHSMVSVNTHLMTTLAGGRTDVTALYAASLTGRVSTHVKLLAEVVSAGTFGGGLGPRPSRDALLSVGVRFFNRHLASEIGVLGLVDDNGYQGPALFLSGSVRF